MVNERKQILPYLKNKVLIIAIMLCLGMILYLVQKTHLHHYFKGQDELSQLLKNNVSDRSVSGRTSQFLYIAHAGGGYLNKRYLNTLEAIENSRKLGVNYMEVDIHYTLDSVLVLSHDFVNLKASAFLNDIASGTHLTLEDFLKWLAHSDLFLITDIKANNIKILQKIAFDYPELKSKIIPQAYSVLEIDPIKKMGFDQVIFTNYVAGYPNCIIEELSKTQLLFAITLPYDNNFKLLQTFGKLHGMPTPILTHTVNDPDVAESLRKSGCDGIYTDFLLLPSK